MSLRGSAQRHRPGPCALNGPGGEEEEEEEEEDEDLEDEVDRARLEKFMRDRRRAQSLPALLSGERKRVKFADSMGLDLASVKHFSTLEEPHVPSKVLSRYRSFPPPQQQQEPLLSDLSQNLSQNLSLEQSRPRLLPCFPRPRDPNYRVLQLRVCLERISATRFDARGHIRALGGAGAEVGVRYTFNDWLTYMDVQALRVPANHNEYNVDEEEEEEEEEGVVVGERFAFTVYAPPFMERGSAVHFAVFLRSEHGEFWDNNQGQNYTLRYRSGHGT